MSEDLITLYRRLEHQVEDFWGRSHYRPRFRRDMLIFGRRFELVSNQEGVLAAAGLSQQMYSTAPARGESPFRIQFVVQVADPSPERMPDDLASQLRYTGAGDWYTIQAGQWGHAFVEMAAGWGVLVLSTELAQAPDLVSQYFMNTLINNFLTRHGFSMLHATALYRDDRLLLLLADHNSGKSTTALHLVTAGYRLFSDSQVYVTYLEDDLQISGFPVGRVRLRPDMLPEFPQFKSYLQPEQWRDEIKFNLDLRRYNPELVCDQAIRPTEVAICLLDRNGAIETHLSPATHSEVLEASVVNSLHFDTPEVWQRNLSRIDRLVSGAELYHLSLGTDRSAMLAAFDSLWSG